MALLVLKWARMLEQIEKLTILKLPTPLIYFLIGIEIYIAFTLIEYGGVEDVNTRFDAYGSSVMIMINTALNFLFFPIAFFASKTKNLSRFVFITFLITTAVTLIYAPAKSSVLTLVFTILFYLFILERYKSGTFSVGLISWKSFFFVIATVLVQILLLMLAYGQNFLSLVSILLLPIE